MRTTRWMHIVGPGIAIAATGVGAGDLIAASVAGSQLGLQIAWAALAGAVLKYYLNEGIARWQLCTGTTLFQGWVEHLGRWVPYVFLVYLLLWSVIVGAALISACGLAANALFPFLSIPVWGVLHSLAALLFVWWGSYRTFEAGMKGLIALMFLALMGTTLFVAPPSVWWHWVPAANIPALHVGLFLGVIGGVGGSLTLLAYGYWARERGWSTAQELPLVRLDLKTAYSLTGLFGFCLIVLAAQVFEGSGVTSAGKGVVLQLANMLSVHWGHYGATLFLWGFWGAVASSMLGVWQAVPYLFCDFWSTWQKETSPKVVNTRSRQYRGYLIGLACVPTLLLFLQKPLVLIILYAVTGSLFMPFLAGTLLVLNSQKKHVGTHANRWHHQLVLLLCLLLFAWLGIRSLLSALQSI